MNATVSIIVPVYNVEKYLEKCINSILNQTYKEIEVILVDDGSTDSSGTICDMYGEKDNRIVVMHQKNGGLSSARNSGIEICSGQWISFVDSDDMVVPEYIEILLRACIENGATIAQGKSTVENVLIKKGVRTDVMTGREMLLSNKFSVSSCCKLYHREIFDEFRFRIGIIYEDYELIYKIFYEQSKVVFVETELYIITEREGSITRQKFQENRLIMIELIEEKIDYFRVRDEKKLEDMALKEYYGILLSFYNLVTGLHGAKIYQKCIIQKYRRSIRDFTKISDLKIKTKMILWICYLLPSIWGMISKKN